MSDGPKHTIRRARADDRGEILETINAVWRRPDGTPGDIAGRQPHLFTPERIPDHWVYEVGGRLWGVVGAYPYDVCLGGVRFKMAGIGQVITRPECRGHGVMSALLRQTIAALEAEGCDAAWLVGDRRRYGHFGWADAGRALHFTTRARYLPDPAAAAIRPLDVGGEFDRLERHIHALPDALLMPDGELRLLFAARGVSGWALGGSFIALDGSQDRVLFADGQPDEIALLIAHQQRCQAERGGPADVLVEAPCRPCLLMRTCREIAARASIQPCASLRIVRLVPFLGKAVRMTEGTVPLGTDRLALVNTDTGEAATLRAARGRVEVTAGAGRGAVRLDTAQLSELFLGWFPPELLLPDLRGSSPLRALLPLNVYLSYWFATVV